MILFKMRITKALISLHLCCSQTTEDRFSRVEVNIISMESHVSWKTTDPVQLASGSTMFSKDYWVSYKFGVWGRVFV